MPWRKTEAMDQKMEFCLKALRGSNFRQLCREYEISTKTGYKWRERFLERGYQGLEELSRRPHQHPEQVEGEQVCEIVKLKQQFPFWGARKIAELYRRRGRARLSESTVKRILERSGLVQKRARRKASQSGRLSSGRKAQAINQVWTVDFKGWWWQGTQRCQPLSVRDEYSRYILELRALKDGRSQSVRESFESLFERYGLPEAIRTDNGSPFGSSQAVWGLSRLSAWWMAVGIELERGRPGHPQDNGAHERMHRDIGLELEALSRGDQSSLDLWRQEYNEQRPHEALGMRYPCEVYQKSQRQYEPVDQLEYQQMARRKVRSSGAISWNDKALLISKSLAGWDVGLQRNAQGELEVWFARLLLGWIEPVSECFLRADQTR
jgi:transposase InsO family protein